MDKIGIVLKMVFPDCKDYTTEQRNFACRLLSALGEEVVITRRCDILPNCFVAVGDEVMVAGHRYRCEERGRVIRCADACLGCGFNLPNRKCGSLQCSKFDREDGRNVWFIALD